MKSVTLRRSGVTDSGEIVMSTWLEASTGTLVSCDTATGWSFTSNRRAYSLASVQPGPDHCSPLPLVFSTSHGGLASTPTRKTPAFWIAWTRGLPVGTASSALTGAAKAAMQATTASANALRSSNGIRQSSRVTLLRRLIFESSDDRPSAIGALDIQQVYLYTRCCQGRVLRPCEERYGSGEADSTPAGRDAR